jgi:hypothetical protein
VPSSSPCRLRARRCTSLGVEAVQRARMNLVALDETPKLHVGIGDLMEHFLVDQRGVVLASARQQPCEEEKVQRNRQRNSARRTQLFFWQCSGVRGG